jgi:hypothetical protein
VVAATRALVGRGGDLDQISVAIGQEGPSRGALRVPEGIWTVGIVVPETDPDGTADGTATGLPMGLRWGCDKTAITAPMGLRYTDPSRELAWLVVEWGVWS